MANIRDVARQAHTSVATVSAVLNGSNPVSPALRARVLAAIGDLDYRPNALARGLTTGKTHTIGLIVPNILTPFAPPLIRAVEQEVTRAGYSLLLALSDADPAKELAMVELMIDKRVDGLLVSLWDESNAARVAALRDAGATRIVLLARRLEQWQSFDAVVSDNLRGAYTGVAHLLERGCRDVAIMALPPRALVERERILGYELAHRERGLTPRPELCCWGATSLEPEGATLSHEATLALFARERPPDGIFICNQTMSFGVLAALAELGRRVPEDVAVACFDDAPWLAHLAVPLTAVAQRSDLLGAKAAQLLLRRLGAGAPPEKPRLELVPTQLVVRASTAARDHNPQIGPIG
ncbi:MAG: LacI family DNA-binding transcriptional regulator [Chloroflexota bacterium]